MGSKGIVASSAALGILLQQGIGDTIRISLTPEPGGDRTLEVKVAQEILQTMGFRVFVPLVAACPGCGRTTSTTFQELARDIQGFIHDSMPAWKTQYPGVEELNVAVMGCIVNGPGESKHADIGISLPGTGETADRAGLHRRQEGRDLARPDGRRGFQEDGDGLYREAIRRGGRGAEDGGGVRFLQNISCHGCSLVAEWFIMGRSNSECSKQSWMSRSVLRLIWAAASGCLGVVDKLERQGNRKSNSMGKGGPHWYYFICDFVGRCASFR